MAVLGAAGFGVGFWVGGWLGAGIGVAVGVAAVFWLLLRGRSAYWLGEEGVAAAEGTLGWRQDNRFEGRHLGYDDLVRRALAELVQPGRLLFNPPDQMRLGQTERVEVRLTRSLELDAELLEGLQGPGKPKLEDIKTASRMAVTLTGDGFHIERRSDEEQAVTEDDITTWEFDVHAKKGGKQQLFMSASLRLEVPGQPLVRKSIPVREVTINVRITVPPLAGVVFGDWRWATGTAVAIAGAVLLVFFH